MGTQRPPTGAPRLSRLSMTVVRLCSLGMFVSTVAACLAAAALVAGGGGGARGGGGVRPRIREGVVKERRDYRPSKWVANSAMDVWYGNKTMIDIIAREFSDIMYKFTSRSVRATQVSAADAVSGGAPAHAHTSTGHVAGEINVPNGKNTTAQSVTTLPKHTLQDINSTMFKH